MSDKGNWISLQSAVLAVHAAVGGAPGPVYQTLISICAEGLVRARWTGHHLRTQPAVLKQDWIGASIDWTTPSGRILKANGSAMQGVDFSEEDLSAWAELQAPTRSTVPRGHHFNQGSARAFVAEYLTADPDGTLHGVRTSAQDAGYIVNRDLIDPEYRRQKAALGQEVRPGRRTQKEKSAEN